MQLIFPNFGNFAIQKCWTPPFQNVSLHSLFFDSLKEDGGTAWNWESNFNTTMLIINYIHVHDTYMSIHNLWSQSWKKAYKKYLLSIFPTFLFFFLVWEGTSNNIYTLQSIRHYSDMDLIYYRTASLNAEMASEPLLEDTIHWIFIFYRFK